MKSLENILDTYLEEYNHETGIPMNLVFFEVQQNVLCCVCVCLCGCVLCDGGAVTASESRDSQ